MSQRINNCKEHLKLAKVVHVQSRLAYRWYMTNGDN